MLKLGYVITAAAVLMGYGIATKAQTESEDEARESLRAAENAFAASVKDRDRDAFLSFIADDAVFVSASTLRGREAIGAAWAPFFAEDGPVLEWHPVDAEVLDSEGLGITRGPYTLTARRPDGSLASSHGTFFSVWQRQDDGSWKILVDSGSLPGSDGEDP